MISQFKYRRNLYRKCESKFLNLKLTFLNNIFINLGFYLHTLIAFIELGDIFEFTMLENQNKTSDASKCTLTRL